MEFSLKTPVSGTDAVRERTDTPQAKTSSNYGRVRGVHLALYGFSVRSDSLEKGMTLGAVTKEEW